jgi:RNA polymerase sigma-70 factor (ECF subfamily)
MMDAELQACIRDYKAGHLDAIERLIEHTRQPLFGFITKMTGGHADSDDIFQEVWVRALRHLDHYRDQRFLSWLFRIAHNLVIDSARKTSRFAPLDDLALHDGVSPSDRLIEPSPNPADEASLRDLATLIARAIARLPPEQREVFLLRTEGNLPFKEIASIQGVSINTALARMQYAVRKLRSMIGEYDPDRELSHEKRQN